MTPTEAFIAATRTRARAYAYLLDELILVFGEEAAVTTFGRATHRLGKDKGASFGADAARSAAAFARDFIGSELGREAFAQSVPFSNEGFARIEMRSCPLVDEWKDMGLTRERIWLLCAAAHRVDYGTAEVHGWKLSIPFCISYGDKACVLELSR